MKKVTVNPFFNYQQSLSQIYSQNSTAKSIVIKLIKYLARVLIRLIFFMVQPLTLNFSELKTF